MKGLIFLLLSLLLVGVHCRPAEPEVRNFGVQPDNPNVKVFFTYPTVPPRIDNPNDLEKGTQNEEKEKYVKDVIKEVSKTKGEGLSKVDNEVSVAAETNFGKEEETLIETNANDRQPMLQEEALPATSNKQILELPIEDDVENERPLMKSKDFASQITSTDNMLGGFIPADIINGEDDADAENNEEAREDVVQNGSIIVIPFQATTSDVSPGLSGLISHPEGDEEVIDNGESEGPILVSPTSEPHPDRPSGVADFSNHSEFDDETISDADIGETSVPQDYNGIDPTKPVEDMISIPYNERNIFPSGDSEEPIVVAVLGEPHSDRSTGLADFSNNSEFDEETISDLDLGETIVPQEYNETDPSKPIKDISQMPHSEKNISPSSGTSVIHLTEEVEGDSPDMEDANADRQKMPLAVRETTVLNSGIPLIPIGVEMVPVIEVVEKIDLSEPHITSEMEQNPKEDLMEMVEATETIMDPIGEVFIRVPNDVNVEVMPNENFDDSPMMLAEVHREMEESLHAAEIPNEAMVIIEKVPSPIAEVEPNVNMPIADVDEFFVMKNEEINPRIQDDEPFLDYMSEIDDKLMESELAAAPQTPDRLMPITEAEVPLIIVDDDHNVDQPLTDSFTDEETNKVDENGAVASTLSDMMEADGVKDAMSEAERPVANENVENMNDKETPIETKSTDDETNIKINKQKKTVEESKVSEIVIPEPEISGNLTTTSAPAVDPIELALQNENYSEDDIFLNETL